MFLRKSVGQRLTRTTLNILIIGCVFTTWTLESFAATYDSPMVAGFERFHRESTGDSVGGGRLLISELSCTACHASSDSELQPKRGPNLAGAARRYQRDWIPRYLANPQAVKPGTTMPNVMHGLPDDKKREAVDAITAFLSIDPPAYPTLVSTASNPIADQFWRKGNRQRGTELYHQVGCVACHEPDSSFEASADQESALEKLLAQLVPDEIEELGLSHKVRRVASVPLGNLSDKYSLKSLVFFLLAPERIRPAGRMPDLKLRPDEAADIAAYLIDHSASEADPTKASNAASLIESGRKWFTELKCVQCHNLDELEPTSVAKPLAELDLKSDRSCLAKADDSRPSYELDPLQVQAIESAIRSINKPVAGNSDVHDWMMKLNCYACHERGQRGGVGPNRRRYFETVGQVDIGDEGRLPPPLDGVGRKLRRDALQGAINADINVRPHMFVRMPKFAATAVSTLGDEFIDADHTDESRANPFPDQIAKLADSGRSLFDTGCVQCHLVRGEHLPGVLGVDLAGAAKRLQPQWFHDFLLNPVALKQRTRMPTFFPGGRSTNPDILDGDTERQIAALWAYLQDIDNQPLPEKIESGKAHNFELIPDERPIVLRTFMEDVGTHAIAIGFPQHVHFAFDAETVRPAQAWRGKFIDAHGTWFDRFTPPAVPLGSDIVSFPAGEVFVTLSRDDQVLTRFGGFRLDPSGVPTFLYQVNGLDIEDRLAPDQHGGITRSIRVKPADRQAQPPVEFGFRANAGTRLEKLGARSYTNDQGFTATLSQPSTTGVVRKSGEMDEWIIPIRSDDETSIEVNYQW